MEQHTNRSPELVVQRTVPLDRDAFNGYVKDCIDEVETLLRRTVAIPEGHEWKTDSLSLAWSIQDPIRATIHGAGIQIGRVWPDERDAKQFLIDIRYFWQERTLEEGGVRQTFGKPQHQVLLWCEQGPPYRGDLRNLLAEDSPALLSAQTVPDLARLVAQAINQVTGLQQRVPDVPFSLATAVAFHPSAAPAWFTKRSRVRWRGR